MVPADPIPAAPEAPVAPPVTPPVTPPSTVQTNGASPSASEDRTPPATAQTGPGTSPQASPVASATAPRSGGTVATSEARTPLRSDYRLSLGTFGSAAEAERATAEVSGLGYTVYPIEVGDQVVAQVGPFADEETARQALADIGRVYSRSILYRPRGQRQDAAASTPSETASSDAAQPANASESVDDAPTASAPAPRGPVYLQVGAFDRVESAQRLVGMLRDEGYAPTVNAPEDSKVTVLIGPFSGDAVTRAEGRLDAGGFDHFRVR